MKVCAQCSRELPPAHPRKLCNTCRKKDVCACGNPKQKCSQTCPACSTSKGNWKGGRTYHKAGYVMVHCPGHPRTRATSAYVFEHILVMEAHLGRYLEKDENVHHINGVKNDNSLGNLELWVRPQPSGIRASDAVAWAREILRRYENTPITNV